MQHVLAALQIVSFVLWSLLIEGEFKNSSKLSVNFPVQDSYDFSCLASMTGSDASTTNYPGKIPAGLDRPSDVVDENKLEKEGPDS